VTRMRTAKGVFPIHIGFLPKNPFSRQMQSVQELQRINQSFPFLEILKRVEVQNATPG
jgi:hypothetical protein